jgi:hypothetical protein
VPAQNASDGIGWGLPGPVALREAGLVQGRPDIGATLGCSEGPDAAIGCIDLTDRTGVAVFCQRMILGMLGIAIFGYAVIRVGFGYPATDHESLTRADAAFVACAGDAMYPAGGAIASSGADADLPAYLDRFLAVSVPRIRILVHLLLFLVEHATLLFPAPGWGGRRRFSGLTEPQRVAVLDGWAESSLFVRRLVFTTLRALLTMGFFAHPPVLRALKLAPLAIDTPIVEADLLYPRIGEHPDSIPFTRADLTPAREAIPLALDAPVRADFRGGAE